MYSQFPEHIPDSNQVPKKIKASGGANPYKQLNQMLDFQIKQAKLEKLKQNEGFEAFGAVITLCSATFVLFFTSHTLGCFYTILISYEDGDNWLAHYNPELVNADVPTRYVVSLYWAMISIRCALV